MSQPQYLLRLGRTLIQTSALRVTRIEKHRVKSVRQSPIGPIREVEGTGRFESDVLRVAVHSRDEQRPILADGRPTGGNRMEQVERSAAGVKRTVRRLRPQEAEQIDLIDARIAEHEAAITELRARRTDLVRDAWSKANVVRLAEIEELISGGW